MFALRSSISLQVIKKIFGTIKKGGRVVNRLKKLTRGRLHGTQEYTFS